MRTIILAVGLCILFTTPSLALTDYGIAKPGVSAKQPGDLSVTIIVSESVKYLEDWVKPGMENKVHVTRITETAPEKLAYCGFLITGLSPSPEPRSYMQYSVDFKLFDPSGKVMFDVPKYAKGRFDNPQKPFLIMADPALDLVLESSDPAGVYTLEATVNDLVTGKSAKGQYQLKLKK